MLAVGVCCANTWSGQQEDSMAFSKKTAVKPHWRGEKQEHQTTKLALEALKFCVLMLSILFLSDSDVVRFVYLKYKRCTGW